MTNDRVRVGVCIILRNIEGDKILLGYRLSEHGKDTWSFPGGHIEYLETPACAARRELAEEIGSHCKLAILTKYTKFPWANTVFPESGKHYITLFFGARLSEGEPKVMEPTKCREWKWFNPENLPYPLFGAIEDITQIWGL